MPPNDEKPAPVPQEPAMTFTKAWGFGKDFLSVLVLPIGGLLIHQAVSNSTQQLQIEQLQKDVAELSSDLKEAQDIDDKVQANALKLATLEGKLDTANGRLTDIKELLRD